MSRPKILSRHDLSDDRCIEHLEDEKGNTYYRVSTDGGAICRSCEDLWMAHIYADQMCQRRRSPAAEIS
jgi:predicted transcriptional regulator